MTRLQQLEQSKFVIALEFIVRIKFRRTFTVGNWTHTIRMYVISTIKICFVTFFFFFELLLDIKYTVISGIRISNKNENVDCLIPQNRTESIVQRKRGFVDFDRERLIKLVRRTATVCVYTARFVFVLLKWLFLKRRRSNAYRLPNLTCLNYSCNKSLRVTYR